MKLYEFFSPPADAQNDKDPRDIMAGQSDHEREQLADEVYWYILDHDELHKKYFIPLAQEIVRAKKSKDFDANSFVPKWLPMVNAACIDYYKEHKEDLKGDPNDLFPKDMRKELCKRLAIQNEKDIDNNEFTLG